jgi:hypothetical protein
MLLIGVGILWLYKYFKRESDKKKLNEDDARLEKIKGGEGEKETRKPQTDRCSRATFFGVISLTIGNNISFKDGLGSDKSTLVKLYKLLTGHEFNSTLLSNISLISFHDILRQLIFPSPPIKLKNDNGELSYYGGEEFLDDLINIKLNLPTESGKKPFQFQFCESESNHCNSLEYYPIKPKYDVNHCFCSFIFYVNHDNDPNIRNQIARNINIQNPTEQASYIWNPNKYLEFFEALSHNFNNIIFSLLTHRYPIRYAKKGNKCNSYDKTFIVIDNFHNGISKNKAECRCIYSFERDLLLDNRKNIRLLNLAFWMLFKYHNNNHFKNITQQSPITTPVPTPTPYMSFVILH